MAENEDALRSVLSATPDGVAIRVKVVPGASRTKLVGLLGDRLKVAVAAPAQGGKANRAACSLLAELMGVAAKDTAVIDGQTSPRKTIELMGLDLCQATERLGALLGPCEGR